MNRHDPLQVNCYANRGVVFAGIDRANSTDHPEARLDASEDLVPIAMLGLTALIRMEQDKVLVRTGIVTYPSWVLESEGRARRAAR